LQWDKVTLLVSFGWNGPHSELLCTNY